MVEDLLTEVTSAPYLSRHVSAAIPVFYGYLFFVCFSSFVHASVTDPGVRFETSQRSDYFEVWAKGRNLDTTSQSSPPGCS